jgi:hypothetical protein
MRPRSIRRFSQVMQMAMTLGSSERAIDDRGASWRVAGELPLSQPQILNDATRGLHDEEAARRVAEGNTPERSVRERGVSLRGALECARGALDEVAASVPGGARLAGVGEAEAADGGAAALRRLGVRRT